MKEKVKREREKILERQKSWLKKKKKKSSLFRKEVGLS